jgi:hypothetical protein
MSTPDQDTEREARYAVRQRIADEDVAGDALATAHDERHLGNDALNSATLSNARPRAMQGFLVVDDLEFVGTDFPSSLHRGRVRVFLRASTLHLRVDRIRTRADERRVDSERVAATDSTGDPHNRHDHSPHGPTLPHLWRSISLRTAVVARILSSGGPSS